MSFPTAQSISLLVSYWGFGHLCVLKTLLGWQNWRSTVGREATHWTESHLWLPRLCALGSLSSREVEAWHPHCHPLSFLGKSLWEGLAEEELKVAHHPIQGWAWRVILPAWCFIIVVGKTGKINMTKPCHLLLKICLPDATLHVFLLCFAPYSKLYQSFLKKKQTPIRRVLQTILSF